jgi:hypothetical protein
VAGWGAAVEELQAVAVWGVTARIAALVAVLQTVADCGRTGGCASLDDVLQSVTFRRVESCGALASMSQSVPISLSRFVLVRSEGAKPRPSMARGYSFFRTPATGVSDARAHARV